MRSPRPRARAPGSTTRAKPRRRYRTRSRRRRRRAGRRARPSRRASASSSRKRSDAVPDPDRYLRAMSCSPRLPETVVHIETPIHDVPPSTVTGSLKSTLTSIASPTVQFPSPESSARSATRVTHGATAKAVFASRPNSSVKVAPSRASPLAATRAFFAPSSASPTVCEKVRVSVPEPPVYAAMRRAPSMVIVNALAGGRLSRSTRSLARAKTDLPLGNTNAGCSECSVGGVTSPVPCSPIHTLTGSPADQERPVDVHSSVRSSSKAAALNASGCVLPVTTMESVAGAVLARALSNDISKEPDSTMMSSMV